MSDRGTSGAGTDGPEGASPPPRPLADRILGAIVAVEQFAAALLLVAIVALVFGQVVARYVFEAPLYWSDELARYTYVWFSFVAAVFVAAQRRHIRVDVLSWLLDRRGRMVLEAFSALAVIAACAFLTWGSWNWLVSTMGPRSSALRLPMVWLYGVVWVCLVAIALHTLVNLVRMLTGAIPVDQPESDEGGTL